MNSDDLLAHDMVLDEEIRVPDSTAPPPTPRVPQEVLLTGATGYLGGRMCRTLLERTSATVYCLVRGARPHARLVERLEAAHDPQGPDLDISRLVTVPGDFTRQRLGLDPDVYDELASRVESVYHCGASIDLGDPYRVIRVPNVVGVTQMLRFATHRRLKFLHHTSSFAIFVAAAGCGVQAIDETTRPAIAYAGPGGYARSKSVAEHLLYQAAERGLPTAIYRVAVLAPDPDSPVPPSAAAQLFATYVRALTQVGAVPEGGEMVGCTVGYASRAITELSVQLPAEPFAAAPSVHHVIDPSPLALEDLARALRSTGHPIASLAPEQWLERLAAHRSRGPARRLAAMPDIWPLLTGAFFPPIHVGGLQRLAAAGVAPTSLDHDTLTRITHDTLGSETSQSNPKELHGRRRTGAVCSTEQISEKSRDQS
ncbi:SDR family oxidoreductase [Actinomadura terrae]|uniref:SDR family oxidoreductase n=1 Tax=Actinomadura terrae TaxID=604353 RepID=UPI001FA7B4D6|nr:SDR family oxidoreductase [Actinomadura terrae]